jgi:hypothetical protein
LLEEMNMNKPSVYIYGMPISKLDSTIYGGLFGNATRAVGLAYNLAKIGHEVFLEVENNFIDARSLSLKPGNLTIVCSSERETYISKSETLLISCTNLQSFEEFFDREPYLEHDCRIVASCFDLRQKIQISRLEATTRCITFNNYQQQSMWEERQSLIPSYVIPYGVNELDEVDEAIVKTDSMSAIWIGAIRRVDMLQRIIRFAAVNPECRVTVATRSIFDNSMIGSERGSMGNPYGDFTGRDSLSYFEVLVKELCECEMPENVNFIGPAEGLNHILQGEHTIGLDFSRFPAQSHDNTKILDYLRSGLCVICDRGTPSYRFVEETAHGVVVSPSFSDAEIREAYVKCLKMSCHIRRKKIAKYVGEKYGWDTLANRFSELLCEAYVTPKASKLKIKVVRLKNLRSRVWSKGVGKLKNIYSEVFNF